MKKLEWTIFIFLCISVSVPAFFSGGNEYYCREIIFFISGILLFILALKNKIVFNKNIAFVLSVLLLSIFFSVIFSGALFVGCNSLVGWLGGILLFFLVYSQKWPQEKIEKLLNIFIASSTIVCLFGFYFYLTGNYNRLTSTFYWPNPFASYLLFSLPILLIWSITKSRYYFYIFMVQFTAFFLADSRGAFISLIFALLFLLFFYHKEIGWNKSRVIGVFFSVLFLTVILYSIRSINSAALARTNPLGGNLDISSQIRLEYWQAAVKIYKDNPVWGSGPGSFALVYPSYQTSPVSSGKYPHDLYLEMLSETGAISLAFFLVFLLLIFKTGIGNGQKKYPNLLLLSGVGAFMVHNGVDVGWHYLSNFLLFWVFAGIIYSGGAGEKKEPVKKRNLIILFLSMLLALCSLWVLVGETSHKLGIKILYYPKSDFLRMQIVNLANDGQFDQAQKISLLLVDIEKGNSLNHELLGRIYLAKGNMAEAEKSFLQAIRLDKNNYPRFYYFLAQTELAQNRRMDAKRSLKEILDIYTKPIINNRKLLILDNQGNPSTNIEEEIDFIENFYNQI